MRYEQRVDVPAIAETTPMRTRPFAPRRLGTAHPTPTDRQVARAMYRNESHRKKRGCGRVARAGARRRLTAGGERSSATARACEEQLTGRRYGFKELPA
jgi:hypothetical protein